MIDSFLKPSDGKKFPTWRSGPTENLDSVEKSNLRNVQVVDVEKFMCVDMLTTVTEYDCTIKSIPPSSQIQKERKNMDAPGASHMYMQNPFMNLPQKPAG